MPVSPRISSFALCALVWAGGLAAGERPERVVSANVCTDQLAMMLADEGQLVSVSDLARDPRVSAMTEEAEDYPVNHRRAEEIYLLEPDLVVAGSFSTRETTGMLRRLGVAVEVFDPAGTLSDVTDRIRQMGRALGRETAAEDLVARFEADLAALRGDGRRGPRAALYAANGYTSGDRTLAGQVLNAAGFGNVADELGLAHGGALPLELLAMSAPAFIVLGETYPGASRAEEILDHPVLAAFGGAGRTARLRGADWACGTPYVLRAISELAEARRGMAPE